jgi:predicted DNA-binding protein YlxM (UPF0122 family)
LAKRLSEKQKKEITEFFTSGKTVEELANDFNCSKLTITRNLRKDIGDKKYKELIIKNKLSWQDRENQEKNVDFLYENDDNKIIYEENLHHDFISSSFTEITPLDCEIENTHQKDLTSVPISEFNFPNIVYMVVDKKIELETKYLADYPEWNFLSKEELNRKTIEIYFDLKIAKRFCNKEQKVIKVPNTEVFRIVSPVLISRGISRIVCPEQLIAL